MKKFFITAVITFSLFLGNVKASTIKTYVNDLQYDSSTLSTSWYTYRAAGNRNIYFDLVFDSEVNNRWNYVSLVLCSSSGFSGGVVPSGYQNYIKGISYVETSYACQYANSSYTGGVVVLINFMLYNGEGEFSGYFTTYQNGSASIQLIDFVVNDNQFASSQNYSSYDLIIKNSQIINQNNTIINQGQQTNDKLDDLNSKQDKTNQELKNMNDFISDDTEADVDVSSLATVTGLLPAGPVDSLLTIPLKFLSVLSSSFSGTCTPVTMNWVFDSQLTLPCFSDSFYNDVPSAIMTFLSIVPCAFILITYFKHLYKKVDRAVSMNTTADDEWGVI